MFITAVGSVYSDGTSSGTGFSLSKIATGTYRVVLDYVPESGAPVTNVTGSFNDTNASNNPANKVWTTQYAQSSVGSHVDIKCFIAGTDLLADAPFNFTVMRYHK